jgi:hypothetical protein
MLGRRPKSRLRPVHECRREGYQRITAQLDGLRSQSAWQILRAGRCKGAA